MGCLNLSNVHGDSIRCMYDKSSDVRDNANNLNYRCRHWPIPLKYVQHTGITILPFIIIFMDYTKAFDEVGQLILLTTIITKWVVRNAEL